LKWRRKMTRGLVGASPGFPHTNGEILGGCSESRLPTEVVFRSLEMVWGAVETKKTNQIRGKEGGSQPSIIRGPSLLLSESEARDLPRKSPPGPRRCPEVCPALGRWGWRRSDCGRLPPFCLLFGNGKVSCPEFLRGDARLQGGPRNINGAAGRARG